jgi:hypothetical protein
MFKYQELVEKVLARNGIANPVEVLYGLLWLLRQHHTMFTTMGDSIGFSDGLDLTTGEHANTLAESIRNYARVTAAANRHNAGVLRAAGNYAATADLLFAAWQIQALCDMLTESIRVWNFKATEAQERIAGIQEQHQQKPPGAGPTS